MTPTKIEAPMNDKAALEAFVARKAEIDVLITRFQAASADHFNCNPEEVHWGHVGDLGYALERLADAASFLQS